MKNCAVNSLVDSNEILKAVFESADIGISIVDADGKFVDVNNSFCEIYGYSKEELIGKSFLKLIPIENQEQAVRQHNDFFEKRDKVKGSSLIQKKDGSQIYTKISSTKIFDESGTPFRVSNIIDISERKYVELLQSVLLEISQAASVANSPDELYKLIHEYVGKIIPVKNFYIALHDQQKDVIKFPYYVDEIDKSDLVIENATENLCLTAHTIRNCKVVLYREIELKRLAENGIVKLIGPMPKVYLASPLMFKNRSIGAIALQSYDDQFEYGEKDKSLIELFSEQIARVIERKKYEEELIYARKEAEEYNRIKSEFLAQMSHEIRTPINSILSFSSLIREDIEENVSDDLQDCFNLIEKGGKRLIRTIDLILNVAQLQTGRYQVDLVEVDLAEELLIPLSCQFSKVAETKGLKLSFKNNVDYSRIVCDHYSLNQLFINLIDNSIKYTLDGSIEIILNKNNDNNLVVDIKDSGIGISEEFQSELFDIFTQEESGYSRKFEGTGLGLSLVKQYAKLNNADIKVKSKKGEGSVFSVIFN